MSSSSSSIGDARRLTGAVAPSRLQRIYGLGGVFGKTIRDSRAAVIVVSVIALVIFVSAGAAMQTAYPTALSRQELVRLAAGTPAILEGLVGKPLNVGTLGGFVAWKYGVIFPLLAGLWSILALSSTLAGEVDRGSMELVAATPHRRWRIALEKLAAHVSAMTVAMVVVGVGAWLSGDVFATVPGDEIPVLAAAGYAAWLGLIALAAGSIAWASAPFLGRGAAAGLAGAIMFGGYILNGYQAAVPVFAAPAQLSWFDWTAGHDPLAGAYDWGSLVPVAILVVVLFALGCLAFARRDLGGRSVVRLPGLPSALAGVREPTGRSFGQLLPSALGWGTGIGLFGLLISASSRSFADELAKSPDLVRMMHSLLPRFDVTTPGGFLTLAFMAYALVLAGLAAATFVSGWAGEEASGRLETVLSTPVARTRWVIRSGIGVVLAILTVTLMAAVGIGIGAAAAGGADIATPIVGTLTIAAYASAMAGVGFAVAGVVGVGRASTVVGGLAIVTLLLDFLAPPLNLPDWVHQLALSAHMGQPMVGIWDSAGIAACLVLAIGGLALGAWGYGHRDIGR